MQFTSRSVALQEGLGDLKDIFVVMAQRRQLQGKHVQPKKEVFAKEPLGHQRPQVAMGGRQHADIYRNASVASQRLHPAFFQHPQQAHLGFQGHVADLVQEKRAAVGLAHPPVARGMRPRKGAPFVAEELRLDESASQGSAVHRHEGTGSPRCLVDRASSEFLAGPRFSQNEHAGLRRTNQIDGLAQLLKGTAVPHQHRAGLGLGRKTPAGNSSRRLEIQGLQPAQKAKPTSTALFRKLPNRQPSL